MRIESFRAWHLAELLQRPAQACMRQVLEGTDYAERLEGLESYTGFIDGRVVVCAGLVPVWPGRAQMWALIANDIGKPGMLALHRAAERFLAMTSVRRIEATVVADFKPGHRWARLLGFDLETPVMAGYGPDGAAHSMYVRVR